MLRRLLAPGPRLDALFVLASFWLVAGLHVDGWAHAHRPGLETFFTPWHAALYSGFGAVALLTAATWFANGRAMPHGYRATFVGVGVFLAGAVGDLLWHELLGVEVSVEALLSPTHLVLAVGFVLMVAGPLRAATRATPSALVSAGLVLALLSFMSQFMHPGGRPWPHAGNRPEAPLFAVAAVFPDYPVFPGGLPAVDLAAIAGVNGIVLASLATVGVLLYVLRRLGPLPAGSFTVVLGVAGLLLAAMRATPWWGLVAVLGGIGFDIANRFLRPHVGGWRLPVFAASGTAVLWAAYFGTLAVMAGVWWSVHLWSGAIAYAALAAALLTLPFATPAPPRPQ